MRQQREYVANFTLTKTLAVTLVLVMALSACSASGEEKEYEIQKFTDRIDALGEYNETPVASVITAEHGTYLFSDDRITDQTLYEYVGVFEEGIAFTSEWFGQDYEALRLFCIQRDFKELHGDADIPISGSGADGVAWIEYDYSAELPPVFLASHVLMHETVHALCDVHSETTNFPKRPEPLPLFWLSMFEEGLATMLEHMYGYQSGKLQDVYMYHYTDTVGFLEIDPGESTVHEVNSVAEALDRLALLSIKEDEFYDELPYDILQTYYTSASFLYYLYEHDNGGKENLRCVYADINLVKEVYGKDMDGMIEEWLSYLEQYSDIDDPQ